jgi:3-oxoacyl-[acyl-carrier-protein] synthase III
MLGLNGVVVKSHGGTDAAGFAHAMDVAMDMVTHRFNERLREGLGRLVGVMAEPVQAGPDGPRCRHRIGARPRAAIDSTAAAGHPAAARAMPRRGRRVPAHRIATNDELRGSSTPPTPGSASAPASASATSPHRTRPRFSWHRRRLRAALADAGAGASDIDAIIVATSTPGRGVSRHRVRVQAALGVTGGFGFDLAAACSGFVYALATADAFIRVGAARNVLVIGSEVYSRILNWQDRTPACCSATAPARCCCAPARRKARASSPPTCTRTAASATSFTSTARSAAPTRAGHLVMKGQEVFRHAVTKLAEAVEEALAANGLTNADVDWLVPHQANRRIIDAMGKRLKLPPERCVITVDRHANTSAASGAAGAGRGRARWPHQTRRSRADGGAGRRPDLGRRAGPPVGQVQSSARKVQETPAAQR